VAWTRFIGPALFLAGLAVLALAIARSEASLFLILVFPVVQATGGLGALGVLLLAAGFIGSLFALPFRRGPEVPPSPQPIPSTEGPPPAGSRRRWGGVVFVGPIPIVFGSDARMTRTMLVLGVALFLVLLAFTLIVLILAI
jgi:uncharacterized protein (TIGR00304 family)